MTSLINKPNSGTTPTDGDHLYVCCACGKTSTTRFGFDDSNKSTASPGWDESCMLNAREYPKSRLRWNANKTRVVEVVP
jgi:hypothetical protein